MSEQDNVCRWDGSKPGHYEVWYLTVNHRPSRTGFWIRYTLESPLGRSPYAQLWFARFDGHHPERTFGIHRTFAIAEWRAMQAPFGVDIGAMTRKTDGSLDGQAGGQLRHHSAHGRLHGHGHRVNWELSWTPARSTHRHLPDIMYRRGGLGETTVLAPNLDVAMRGAITVDDERYTIDEEPGGQTHLWGRKHAHQWAWGHCNAFSGRPGAAIELLSVNLKRGGIHLPRLTVFSLYLDGRVHRFNGFRHTLLTGAEYAPGRFEFSARKRGLRIEGCFSCPLDNMVLTPYLDPDGEPSYCANSEIADLSIDIYERASRNRWREADHLLAPGSGHFEVGSRTRPTGITAEHRLIKDSDSQG